MRGTVQVIAEPNGVFMVACFRDDCPEDGTGVTGVDPWVSEHRTRKEATAAAVEHRRYIDTYWAPDRCPTCDQRVPTTPAPSHPARRPRARNDMSENEARTWPDWRGIPADQAIEHVR